MKRLISRIPPILKNFYVLSLSFFIVWLLFFDSNDVVTQVKLSRKQSDLKEAKQFYEKKIEQVKVDREALLNNKELLEKLAREKYFMKKENEDVFIVVEE